MSGHICESFQKAELRKADPLGMWVALYHGMGSQTKFKKSKGKCYLSTSVHVPASWPRCHATRHLNSHSVISPSQGTAPQTVSWNKPSLPYIALARVHERFDAHTCCIHKYNILFMYYNSLCVPRGQFDLTLHDLGFPNLCQACSRPLAWRLGSCDVLSPRPCDACVSWTGPSCLTQGWPHPDLSRLFLSSSHCLLFDIIWAYVHVAVKFYILNIWARHW